MYLGGKTYLVWIGVAIMLFIAGCRGKRLPNEANEAQKGEGSTSQLQFITFNVAHDTVSNKTVISLLDMKTVNGDLKPRGAGASIGDYPNSISFYQYCDGKKLDSITMAHPLYHNIEYIGGHSDLNTKAVALSTAGMSIRLHKGNGDCELRIYESLQGKGTQALTTIKL